MAKPEQVNAGFRLPAELVEWLDNYVEFLNKEWGTKVSRTQALIRLVTMSRKEEERRMKDMERALEHGFVDPRQYTDWLRGASALLKQVEKSKGLKSPYRFNEDWTRQDRLDYWWTLRDMPNERSRAIAIGKDLRDKEVQEFIDQIKIDSGDDLDT